MGVRHARGTFYARGAPRHVLRHRYRSRYCQRRGRREAGAARGGDDGRVCFCAQRVLCGCCSIWHGAGGFARVFVTVMPGSLHRQGQFGTPNPRVWEQGCINSGLRSGEKALAPLPAPARAPFAAASLPAALGFSS